MFLRTVHRNGVTHGNHELSKLDDDEIVKLVDDNVRTSTGYSSSDLAKEREKVLNYYNGHCRNRHMTGTASMSPKMSITPCSQCSCAARNFAAGNRIVKFAPQGQTMSSRRPSARHTRLQVSEPMMATLYFRRSFRTRCSQG